MKNWKIGVFAAYFIVVSVEMLVASLIAELKLILAVNGNGSTTSTHAMIQR
jgi:hypothetical protein